MTSKDMPFHLIDDIDMTPQLQSRLENDGYTLEREPESGVWEVSRSISNQDLKSADMENSDNLFKKIRDASKKILSTFLGKTSKNNIDGREVKFTKRSLDKMTSGSAVGKSLDNGFTREEHYEAAQNILEIFKTAKFIETQPPKNGSPDILGVHKYMGEYKNANVKITIKEIKEHGNTFYSIELMELLSRDMQSGDPKTGNLDNTAIIHTDEEPPRPRTSSPYNANSKTIPNQDLKSTEFAELTFKDKKGKDHIITKEIQKEWIDTFGLKNLDDIYIPKFNNEIKKALGNKELKLQKGSLLKLVSQGRQKFIPEIKKVLDDPEIIITDKNGEIILAKHLKDKDYFVNVSFDNGEYLISISNGIKEINNLNNKIKQGGKILYQSPNANSISQTLLQTSQYSANKIDAETIPNQDLKSADMANVSDEIGINSTKDNFKYLIKDTFSFPNLRDMLKNKLSFILKKDITNKETGLTGIITEAERNKISSSKAVNKSIQNGFSKEEHFKVAEDIKNIFENASLIQKHNDYKNRKNILAVYRFSKSVNINNKEANAKITLLEKMEGKNKIYTIELDSLDRSNPLSTPYSDAGLAVKAQDTRDGVRPNASIAKTDESKSVSGRRTNLSATQSASEKTTSQNTHTANSTPKTTKSQELNLSRAERRAMGIEEPKGKTLVIDEKAVKNDVREFGRLAHQVGLGFKSAKEAKAVMDKCDKSKFDCGS